MPSNRDVKYPKDIQLLAQHLERDTKIPTCVTLAQWALESACGKRMAGKNNPFGMKFPDSRSGRAMCAKLGATPENVATHEVEHGKSVAVRAPFVAFKTLADAFTYRGWHLALRKDGPYTFAIKLLGGDWRIWLRAIVKGQDGKGLYATDPDYESKLLGIIESDRLADFNLPKGAPHA